MDLKLLRHGSIPGKGTFGDIHGFPCIEREWLNNAPNVSCVPTGTYKLVPHSSQKRHIGETWALVNEPLGIYHYPDEDNPMIKRWGILIHIANRPEQLEGCIGVGSHWGVSTGKDTLPHWGVSSSRRAMEHFLALLSDESEHTLTIKYAEH